MLTPGRASTWKIWTIGKISFKVSIFNAVNKANYKNCSLFHRSVSDKSQSWDGKIFFDQRDFILNVKMEKKKKNDEGFQLSRINQDLFCINILH